jgi:hypothetical protein
MPRLNRSTGRERGKGAFSDETKVLKRAVRSSQKNETSDLAQERNENKKLGKRLKRERERGKKKIRRWDAD